jgi:hypothetical protein
MTILDRFEAHRFRRTRYRATSHSFHEPRYWAELRRGMIKLDECLVDIAPAPTLWWLVTLDDRVSVRLKMLVGVFAGGLVATTDVAA